MEKKFHQEMYNKKEEAVAKTTVFSIGLENIKKVLKMLGYHTFVTKKE